VLTRPRAQVVAWLLRCADGDTPLRPIRRRRPGLAHHPPPAASRRSDLGSTDRPLRRGRPGHPLASPRRLVRTPFRSHRLTAGTHLPAVPGRGSRPGSRDRQVARARLPWPRVGVPPRRRLGTRQDGPGGAIGAGWRYCRGAHGSQVLPTRSDGFLCYRLRVRPQRTVLGGAWGRRSAAGRRRVGATRDVTAWAGSFFTAGLWPQPRFPARRLARSMQRPTTGALRRETLRDR
jgi:hypothetical protein